MALSRTDENKREYLARMALMAAYAFVHWRMLPLWELSGDDGNALFAAWRGMKELFWLGPSSSLGVLHPSVVYYAYTFFLKVHESLTSVQLGIVCSHLLAHWLLIGYGKRIYSTPVAYFASLLAFTNPNFLAHYDQRFWEPALLPLFSMAALACLLRFHRCGSFPALLGSLAMVIAATSGHLSAILFLPVIGIFVARSPYAENFSPRQWLIGAAFLAILFVPYVAWIEQRRGLSAVIAAVSAGSVVSFFSYRWAAKARLERIAYATMATFSLAFAVIYFLGTRHEPVAKLGILFDAFGHHQHGYSASPYHGPSWSVLPMLLVFLSFLVRETILWPSLSGERKIVYFWILLPLALLFPISPFSRWFPPHWMLLIFPVAWLGCAEFLSSLFRAVPHRFIRLSGNTLIAAGLLVVQLSSSWSLISAIKKSDGIGERMATLEKKLAVMEKILSSPGTPKVTLMIFPFTDRGQTTLDLQAWNFLYAMGEKKRNGRIPSPTTEYYYIFQEGHSQTQPQLKENLLQARPATEEKFGSLTLFRSSGHVDGTGVRLDGG